MFTPWRNSENICQLYSRYKIHSVRLTFVRFVRHLHKRNVIKRVVFWEFFYLSITNFLLHYFPVTVSWWRHSLPPPTGSSCAVTSSTCSSSSIFIPPPPYVPQTVIKRSIIMLNTQIAVDSPSNSRKKMKLLLKSKPFKTFNTHLVSFFALRHIPVLVMLMFMITSQQIWYIKVVVLMFQVFSWHLTNILRDTLQMKLDIYIFTVLIFFLCFIGYSWRDINFVVHKYIHHVNLLNILISVSSHKSLLYAWRYLMLAKNKRLCNKYPVSYVCNNTRCEMWYFCEAV